MAMAPSGMAGPNAPVEATASSQVVRLDDDRVAHQQVRCAPSAALSSVQMERGEVSARAPRESGALEGVLSEVDQLHAKLVVCSERPVSSPLRGPASGRLWRNSERAS